MSKFKKGDCVEITVGDRDFFSAGEKGLIQRVNAEDAYVYFLDQNDCWYVPLDNMRLLKKESTDKLKVKFKKLHPDAVLPTYAKPGDAGLDLTVVAKNHVSHSCKLFVAFGVSVEIPAGYVGRIYPRSSVYKKECRLSNCVGVIDSGYRGELMAVFDTSSQAFDGKDLYIEGERAAQLIIEPIPTIEPEWADELSETERGTGGYGSSGK